MTRNNSHMTSEKSLIIIGAGMAGQWVETFSGIPGSALSGRNVIQLLCRRDHKKFVTSTASA